MNSEGFRYDVNEWTAGKVLARHARNLGSKTFVHLVDSATLSRLVKLTDRYLAMTGGYWLTWPARHSWRADDDAIVSTLCGDG